MSALLTVAAGTRPCPTGATSYATREAAVTAARSHRQRVRAVGAHCRPVPRDCDRCGQVHLQAREQPRPPVRVLVPLPLPPVPLPEPGQDRTARLHAIATQLAAHLSDQPHGTPFPGLAPLATHYRLPRQEAVMLRRALLETGHLATSDTTPSGHVVNRRA